MASRSLTFLLCLSLQFFFSYASPRANSRVNHRVKPRQEASTTTSTAPAASPTACGWIIDNVNEGYTIFYAKDAFDCLTTVPFNSAVALRFIDYYNTTMQFQSTLAYAKNPPEGYQRPAVDFFGELQGIKDRVNSGYYKNQYAFETEVQHLVRSVHDSHVDLYAGIIRTFDFFSPWPIVSASEDGQSEPKVYISDDIYQRRENHTISPVDKINGVGVVEYLTRFGALNSIGLLEPHGDWNRMMSGPSSDITPEWDSFSGAATFYEGDDLIFTFENGSVLETKWYAAYTIAEFTGPLTTGGDYYNFFVLNIPPASLGQVPLPPYWESVYGNGSTDVDWEDGTDYTYGWYDRTGGAYPKADVVQQDIKDGGWVTGYLFQDISTGILSIPSFEEYSWSVGNFSQTVDFFIGNATEKNISRIIVDLQGNTGGTPLLAFSTFRQLFPGIEPFAGSRRRSHEMANVLGTTLNEYYSQPANDQSGYGKAEEWVVTDRLNVVTNQTFENWAEYYGPREENGDKFSLVERYNLADVQFQWAAFNGWADSTYVPGHIPSGPGPWKAEDVVILTDGLCSSTCTLFVEMMTQQAGVRTIVMGGQPQHGPMQAASGTRGAVAYSADMLDDDFYDTTYFNDSTAGLLPSRDVTGMFITSATFNLRDQVRTANSPAVPLQFVYAAADCRLYYTLDNVFDMSIMWRDVAAAAWHNDSSLCVPDSTGYATTGKSATAAHAPPKATAIEPQLPSVEFGYDVDPTENGMADADELLPQSAGLVPCDPDHPYQGPPGHRCVFGSSRCIAVKLRCDLNSLDYSIVHVCSKPCSCVEPCRQSDRVLCNGPDQDCYFYDRIKPKPRDGISLKSERITDVGYCVPEPGNTRLSRQLGCPSKSQGGSNLS